MGMNNLQGQAQAAKAVIKQVSESRKSMAPNVDEGVVDAVKAGAKKAFKALTGPDDEELIQRLEKETGGKRPEKKETKDVDEALLLDFGKTKARLVVGDYPTQLLNDEIVVKVKFTTFWKGV